MSAMSNLFLRASGALLFSWMILAQGTTKRSAPILPRWRRSDPTATI